MYSCRRIQNGVWGGAPTGGWGGRAPPLQNLLTNRFPYSGFTFQVQLQRSLHVYAISEVIMHTHQYLYASSLRLVNFLVASSRELCLFHGKRVLPMPLFTGSQSVAYLWYIASSYERFTEN